MTVSNVQATQLSNSQIQISWQTDDVLPGTWNIRRNLNAAGLLPRADLDAPAVLTFFDSMALTVGDTYQFEVKDQFSGLLALSPLITVQDLEQEFTYGAVNYLASTARYTSVALVKERLAIDATDASRDSEILSACIAGELAMDIFMGRSLPDTGTNPMIPGVPDGIKQAALQTAIAIWKEADAPTGSSGSESFMGALSVSETTRTMIQQSAVLIGFRVKFGVA
jgi:hypothetical protein